eukprot:52135-Rhodomonas_salina.1
MSRTVLSETLYMSASSLLRDVLGRKVPVSGICCISTVNRTANASKARQSYRLHREEDDCCAPDATLVRVVAEHTRSKTPEFTYRSGAHLARRGTLSVCAAVSPQRRQMKRGSLFWTFLFNGFEEARCVLSGHKFRNCRTETDKYSTEL